MKVRGTYRDYLNGFHALLISLCYHTLIMFFSFLFFHVALLADDFPTQKKNLQLTAILNYESQHGSWYEDEKGNSSNFFQGELGVGYFIMDNLLVGLGFSIVGLNSAVDDYSTAILRINLRVEYYLRDLIGLVVGKNPENFLPFLFIAGNHKVGGGKEVFYEGTSAEYDVFSNTQSFGYGFGVGMLIMLSKYVGFKPFLSYNTENITQYVSSIKLNINEKNTGKGFTIDFGLWLVGIL